MQRMQSSRYSTIVQYEAWRTRKGRRRRQYHTQLLHWQVFGCPLRGTGRPLDHATGVGRVDAHAGYYADAREKGHCVELLLTEVHGGVHGTAIKMLSRLERDSKRDGARDGTVYGRSLTSAKGFTSHWLRMISASIAGSVGVSIGSWAHDKARALLDLGDLADIDTDAT